jgi:hypothetical protein
MWLSFQINCQDWDPFLETFQTITFLLDINPPIIPRLNRVAISSVVLICVDASQEDLQYETGPGNSLFEYALSAFHIEGLMTIGFNPVERLIFARTSFNLLKALHIRQKAIDAIEYSDYRDFLRTGGQFRFVTHYRHVRNNTDTATILQGCGLKVKKLLEVVPEHGRLLRGRVKWTTMFTERVLDGLKTNKLSNSEEPELSEEQYTSLDIRKVTEDSYETIVAQLSHKLDLIKGRQNGEYLLRTLLEAEISADIRNSPHIFERKSDLELVEHRFATVTNKIDKAMDELEVNFITSFNSLRRFELEVRRREHCDVENGIVDLLAKASRIGFSVNGWNRWILNKFTPEMWNRGFTIVETSKFTCMLQVDTQTNAGSENEEKRIIIKEVINELGQQNRMFANYVPKVTFLPSSNSQLLVNMKVDSTFQQRIATELTLKLKQSDFFNYRQDYRRTQETCKGRLHRLRCRLITYCGAKRTRSHRLLDSHY